jgi:hypothetical protein
VPCPFLPSLSSLRLSFFVILSATVLLSKKSLYICVSTCVCVEVGEYVNGLCSARREAIDAALRGGLLAEELDWARALLSGRGVVERPRQRREVGGDRGGELPLQA